MLVHPQPNVGLTNQVPGEVWASSLALKGWRPADGRVLGKTALFQSVQRRTTMEFQGYCVKCRESRTITDGKETETSKGRPMAKGTCPKCGTTVTRFLSTKKDK